MSYLALKHSHAGLAYLTVLFFILRFVLFTRNPATKQIKLFKILPHVIDASLLALALMMLFSSQFGLPHSWAAAKIIGLLFYIGFGVAAIRGGKLWGFGGALASYAYVLGVAKTKTALSWLIFIL